MIHLWCPKCEEMREVVASACRGAVRAPVDTHLGVFAVSWGSVKVSAKPKFICASCGEILAKNLKDLELKVYADPHYRIPFGGIVETKEGLYICGENDWWHKPGGRLALYPISKKAALKYLKENGLSARAIYKRKQFSAKEFV